MALWKLNLLGTVEQLNVSPFQLYIYHLYNVFTKNKLYNKNYVYSLNFSETYDHLATCANDNVPPSGFWWTFFW